MVDNFKQIKALMKFENPGDFYFIQVIKRRKDNPGLARDMKRVAEYYIYSLKYLEEHEQQIIDEATLNNARVYIHLHRRNSLRTILKTIEIITNYLATGQYEAAKTAYTSACGKQHSDREKKWIIDVDTKDVNVIDQITLYISQQNPIGLKQIAFIPTKNGVHIVTKPFRKDGFNKQFPDVGIHIDTPTVLFIP